MKWWYWLILELLIIFGVMAWIFFFPSDFEYDFAKGMVGFVFIWVIEETRNICRRNKMAKSTLNDQLQSYESYINDIPNVIDPCKQCKVYIEHNGWDVGDRLVDGIWKKGACDDCCWCYSSKFEIGE